MWRRRIIVRIAAGLLALAAIPGLAQRPAAAGLDSRKSAAIAFRAGEKLQYSVRWANLMTAATAELTVRRKQPFYGREAWHLQALARTVDLARSMYELDDQFDSYSDANTLATFRYEAYVREQGKRENTVVRMSGEGLPVQDGGAVVRVPPGTRDPLSVLYYLRTIDWSRQNEVQVPVFNGRRMFEVHARLVKTAQVTVAAGRYPASCIELRVFERNRELTGVRIWIWFANDESRTPALIEAEMPFGELRVELVRASVERVP